ncbi:MAG TPA: hypothetical protein VGV64_05170 [Thermoplasmata archaeon]|nr:hypothetical protein [Thermoplasmata archaeon]
MAPLNPPDPVRETLLAILRQLNQADAKHEGQAAEQALELSELQDRLGKFGPVEQGKTTIALALGLLVRNNLVGAVGSSDYSWQRGRTTHQLYQITAEGKKFLVDAMTTSDRVA